ncbi:S41 family peptidase [Christensenella tenuis]|uniref:S41 family peptidase n=1 Tax=Christensenella tenuis TaxID=2763033 RepID=A0ABR7EDB4_9FIRM|nr:S41 family peptidase [Christensenella tenuis]MBC5647774.1 S41 family peptidase [Christensenella tenuis]
MDKKKLFIVCVVIAVTASFVTGLFVYFYQTSRIKGNDILLGKGSYQDIQKYMEISDLEKIISDTYYRDIDQNDLVTGTLKGMVESLNDPYSVYYTEEEYKEFNQQSDADLVGIGVTAGPYQKTGHLKVERVYAGSPAETAGIVENDVILTIDGTDVGGLDYESSLNMLRGPSGSSVKLTVQTGADAPRELEVARANVDAQRVTYTMLTDDIAQISISEFNGNCVEEFKNAIQFLKDEDAKGVLIDVRGNMDGSVLNAVSMLDEILPEGLAAYTVDKENKRDELTVDANYYELPLVVLVDGNSASAAEVFAGAVQGRGRGQVIGTQTYGKGVVQSIVDMPYSGGGVKLTSALYYTPDEKAVNDGITPDIVVSNPEGRLTFETDAQLQQALTTLGEPGGQEG